MIRFDRTVRRPEPPGTLFEFFGDLANAHLWDPGVQTVAKLTPGPVRVGSIYSVEATFLSGGGPVRYEVSAWEPSQRVEFVAKGAGFRASDRISFAPEHVGGCIVRYEAEVVLSWASPRVVAIQRRVFLAAGEAAMRGLGQVEVSAVGSTTGH
jgi:hypothetical protein